MPPIVMAERNSRKTHSSSRTTLPAPDGTALGLTVCPGSPSGTVALVLHGLVSHSGWYQELARALAQQGLHTYLIDRRGCGHSEGERGHVDSWRTLVADTAHVVKELKNRHPGKQVNLIGISLGGVVSLALGIMHPELIARQAILAPGLASKIGVSLRRRLRLVHRAFTQPLKRYDIPFDIEDMTDRKDWQAILGSDPLRTTQVTARFLVEFFRMQKWVGKHAHDLRTPVFCMLGGDDAIIDNERVIDILSRVKRTSVSIEIFDHAQHVLPASVPGSQIVSRIRAWFVQESDQDGRRLSRTDTTSFFRPGESQPNPPILVT